MRKPAFSMYLHAMLIILFLLPTAGDMLAQNAMPAILPMKDRAELRDQWLDIRLKSVVPELMRRNNVDMWIIIAREYNEDPVVKTMLPATWLNARRRTILLFFDRGQNVEQLAIARYDVGRFFRKAWDKEKQPDQWQQLVDIITERKPKKIALNYSPKFALADGITHSEYEALMSRMPQDLRKRVVPGENLAIGWLETRIDPEAEVYPQLCRIAHMIIAEGLSEAVIQPGVTSTSDVQWWYREKIRELKLTTWFHPSVSVQRQQNTDANRSFASRPAARTIRPGDLIHIDLGITYLGLNTDTQQHAYVLRPGETDAPEGLKKALTTGNRLQDILTSQFKTGRTGNEMLHATRKQAITEGIVPSVYTHPLGVHGHGAGPLIGLWDQQEGVPGRGDYPLYANTAFSIELNAKVKISEWGNQEVRIMLEEDAFFDGETVRYLDGRQKDLWLIPRPSPNVQ